MKRIFFAVVVAVLAVMLVAAVSQATTLTLQSSHTLTPTVVDKASGAITPTGGSIQAGVDGNSYFDPSQNPAANSQSDTLTIGANNSVGATLGSLTWLQTTAASVAYTGSTNTFTMAQTYVANAPNPSNGDGYFIQNGSLTIGEIGNVPTYFSLTYSLTAGHSYTVTLADAYRYLYQLVNSSGTTNLFDTTYGKLLLYASITYPGGSGDVKQYIVGDAAPDFRSGTPVSNFIMANNAGSAILGLTIDNVKNTGTLTFEGYLVTQDYGYSYTGDNPVPAPATLLLLGSGLVGLLALRGRRKADKS